jgi:hypothetical protein
MLKKLLPLTVFLLISPIIFAAANKTTTATKPTYTLNTLPTEYAFNFQSVSMPGGQSNMGLVGISYLFDPMPWLYAGFSGYGAVSGDQGGLFVLGLTAGVHHKIIGNVWGNAGFFIGGGGGHSSEVGGGLMIRPDIGLAYDFGKFKLGVDYTKVKFPDSDIDSNQFGLTLNIPTDILYGDPSYNYNKINKLNQIDLSRINHLFFEKNYIAIIEQTYFQRSSAKNNYNQVTDSPLSLVGAEVGHYFNDNVFFFVKLAGAFAGDNNGYMDVLGGLGYRYYLSQKLSVNGRLAAGAGGGGNTRVGGGILVEPSVGLQYQFLPYLGAEISGGYLKAVSDDFGAATLNFKLIYSMMTAEESNKASSQKLFGPYSFRTWRFRFTNQTYLNPQRTNGIDGNINLFTVKADSMITKYIYMTGQAAGAYSGDAGGYATGMVGLGAQTKMFLKDHLNASAELLVGAGGGGSMDVGGGALVQPVVNLNYYFNHYIGVQASVGRIISPRKNLSSTTIDIGFIWQFSTLQQDSTAKPTE